MDLIAAVDSTESNGNSSPSESSTSSPGRRGPRLHVSISWR